MITVIVSKSQTEFKGKAHPREMMHMHASLYMHMVILAIIIKENETMGKGEKWRLKETQYFFQSPLTYSFFFVVSGSTQNLE